MNHPQGDELAAHDELEEALERYDRALLADRKQHGDAHPDVAARYCSIGGLYKATGDNEMAREYFAKALEVEESSGSDGRRTARASYVSNLAAVSRAAGDVDLARDQYCMALEHLRGMIPRSNEDVEAALSKEEASMYGLDGDTSTSGHGHDVSGHDPPPNMLGEGGSLNVAASVLNNLGLLFKSIGRLHAARRCYVRAISLGGVALGAHSPSIALRLRNLGAVLLQLGYRDLAVERLTKAHGSCSLGYGADHPETVMCAEWLHAATESVEGEHVVEAAAGTDLDGTLPDVCEWFCETLRCGVLEPTPEPSAPGEERAVEAIAPATIGLEDAMVPAAENAEVENAAVSHRGGLGKAPYGSEPGTSVASYQRFNPVEPPPGEDMLSPYAAPVTSRDLKRVGNAETSPVWRAVALEHEAIVSGKSSMPRGQDYISAYLRQAPGYANLITPFQEMPSDLMMPYASFRGYGAPLKSGVGRQGKGEPRRHQLPKRSLDGTRGSGSGAGAVPRRAIKVSEEEETTPARGRVGGRAGESHSGGKNKYAYPD